MQNCVILILLRMDHTNFTEWFENFDTQIPRKLNKDKIGLEFQAIAYV